MGDRDRAARLAEIDEQVTKHQERPYPWEWTWCCNDIAWLREDGKRLEARVRELEAETMGDRDHEDEGIRAALIMPASDAESARRTLICEMASRIAGHCLETDDGAVIWGPGCAPPIAEVAVAIAEAIYERVHRP